MPIGFFKYLLSLSKYIIHKCFFIADISQYKFALFITCSVVLYIFSPLQIAADVLDAVRKTFIVVVKHSSEGKVELSFKKDHSFSLKLIRTC